MGLLGHEHIPYTRVTFDNASKQSRPPPRRRAHGFVCVCVDVLFLLMILNWYNQGTESSEGDIAGAHTDDDDDSEP